MRKFRGGLGGFVGLMIVFMMMGVAPLWLTFLLPGSHDTGQDVLLRVFFGGMGLGFGWYYGWGLLEWFTVYHTDEDGITRRAWNGTRRMRWNEIASFKASGHKDGTLTLTDTQNRKLLVVYSLLSAGGNRELRSIIALHLAPLRERQMRDIGSLDTVYRPNRGQLVFASASILAFGVFFLVGGLTMLTGSSPDETGAVIFFVMGLLLGLPGARATAWALSRTLSVTHDGLTESSMFGSKTVRFHQVTALMTREVANKDDKWEAAQLTGENGQKILLNSKMTDYPLLVEFIRARVPGGALTQGKAEAEAIQRQNDRQNRIIGPVSVALIIVMCVTFGVLFIQRSAPILARERQIDAHHQTTTGYVTQTIASSGKDSPNKIAFAFTDAQGRRVVGVSPVPYSAYRQAKTGDSLPVQYVPGHPDLCRTASSISSRNAIMDVVIAAFVSLFGGVVVPCSAYITSKKQSLAKATETIPS